MPGRWSDTSCCHTAALEEPYRKTRSGEQMFRNTLLINTQLFGSLSFKDFYKSKRDKTQTLYFYGLNMKKKKKSRWLMAEKALNFVLLVLLILLPGVVKDKIFPPAVYPQVGRNNVAVTFVVWMITHRAAIWNKETNSLLFQSKFQSILSNWLIS